MTEPAPTQPDPLMDVILALLAPLLMLGGLIDVQLARLAAAQAIEACGAGQKDQLLTAAQIAGFAVTALDNLRLSTGQDLSLAMKLRLRGNAASLGRAARQGTQALEKTRPPAIPPHPDPAEQPAARAAIRPAATQPEHAPAPVQKEPPPPAQPDVQDRQSQLAWASAMTAAAAELRTGPAHAAAAPNNSDQLWINVLTDVAGELRRNTGSAAGQPPIGQPPIGQPPIGQPPFGQRSAGLNRSALLRTTLLSSDPGFPAHRPTGGPLSRKAPSSAA